MSNHGLNQNVTRMLHDKLYEKRKAAALEIEKLVRSYASESSHDEIEGIIEFIKAEYTSALNPNSRKGGLIGLAACAIGLGSQHINKHLASLLTPVLVCSADSDSRMRYFSCEALYNLVKVSYSETLNHFNEVFDALSKFASDPDQNVRKGAELLDRLLKDVVTETPSFDSTVFVMMLRERLYTNKQYTRRFLVQWLNCIISIPYIDVLAYLPLWIDPLFIILGDSSKDIRQECHETLVKLLSKIEQHPEKADFPSMINLVVVHCESSDLLIKEAALTWMYKFISLAKSIILPFASGIVGAVLSTLAYEDVSNNSIREIAKRANQSLMKLITCDYDKKKEEGDSDKSTLPLVELVQVFTTHLNFKSTSTKIAVIKWINHLLLTIPSNLFDHIEEIFVETMKMLSDEADDLVFVTLECLTEIASSPAGQPLGCKVFGASAKPAVDASLPSTVTSSSTVTSPFTLNVYFPKLIGHLLHMLKNDQDLLEKRSSFIIRQLSVLLNAENVFRALATSLLDDDEARFAAIMVKKLSSILITSPELVDLRDKLKTHDSNENSELFCCLYKSWCNNPVAAVTLCLLTQNYEHCCRLLNTLSDKELTVDLLIEMDKLVQLLESPIFAYLRLQLLESPPRHHLIKSLYSLLMLLPQSRSFDTLHQRLSCVPHPHSLPPHPHSPPITGDSSHKHTEERRSSTGNRLKQVDFDALYCHFAEVQNRHKAFRLQHRLKATNGPGVRRAQLSHSLPA